MTSKSVISLACAVGALFVAGCGSDAPDASPAGTQGSADGAAPADESFGSDPTGDFVDVRAIDFAYLDVPTSVSAGTSFSLTNESSAEAHELVAVRLPDDERRPVAELVTLPPEEFGPLMRGVRTVVLAAPDEQGIAVVGDGSLDEPGRYALICVIPTGADPQEYLTEAATSDGPPDVAGGPPHMVNGMFAEISVTG